MTEEMFSPYRPETGEGSLLAATVALVEEKSKAELEGFQVDGGGIAPIVRNPHGTVEVLKPSTFDDYRDKPLFRSGNVQLADLDSLIAYTNAFKDANSAVFADDMRTAPAITAVLDYHAPGGPLEGGQRFGRHKATHTLPLSDEWSAWHELDGDKISMPNFARFLEDHIVDVLGPGQIELSPAQEAFVDALGGRDRIATPAKLMELATGLRVYENAEVNQAVNLQSGEGALTMVSQHTDGAGAQLIVPKMFVIAIPVFHNGPAYQIITRLRYRKEQGINFIYELWRADLVFDHAFNEAVDRVKDETQLATFKGRP
jgi:uncharacterized protein YfdQ (DUF2303 family)